MALGEARRIDQAMSFSSRWGLSTHALMNAAAVERLMPA
jgi:hypothetical protein